MSVPIKYAVICLIFSYVEKIIFNTIILHF